MRGRTEGVREPTGSVGSSAFALDVLPDAENVRTARLFAAAIARHFGADVERVEDLKVAISEAVTNSIAAHEEAGAAEPIRVAVAVREESLEIAIVDAGAGFDVESAAVDSTTTPPAGFYKGSLGLTLIRSLFPDVEIARNGNRGMRVSFVIATGEAV